MSLPIPLGVRIFNAWSRPFDLWITRLVDDIQYRSVIPGGFANATITVYDDGSAPWDLITQPLTRVQVVDLRSQEIAWEGRVDSRRRNSAADTWELGCLGSMAYASDIQRPMFYIDSDADSWLPPIQVPGDAETYGVRLNSEARQLLYAPIPGSYGIGHTGPVFFWEKATVCGLYIGRFDATYSGNGSSNIRNAMDVEDASGGHQTNVVLRSWASAAARLSSVIVTNFSALDANRIILDMDRAAVSTVSSGHYGLVSVPRVQVQRVDEFGTKLQTAASYPNEYLTVEQIVRDVVGRFMGGAWLTSANDTPYAGHVGGDGIYVDSSSTAQITHLTYYDGATAAQILNDMMQAQPNAYWALWESRFGATTDGTSDSRFRFEWATWPAGYIYQATSVDGLEEQPDGGELMNFVWWKYPTDVDPAFVRTRTYWNTAAENQLLSDARVVRGVTVESDTQMSSATALTRAQEYFDGRRRTVNTGTLTIKRPIFAYDPGSNSASGIARMLDPWLIRPGKLIRITDIPPRGNSNTFGTGSTAFAPELDGTVFRVVGTTYSSADNSCVLELDKPPSWDTATQVLESGSGSSNLVVRG